MGNSEREDRIKLRWLLRLRWGALAGQAATIGAVALWKLLQLPLRPLLLLVALGLLGNLALELWTHRGARGTPAVIAGLMIADALSLTTLLALSGSYSNPFSTLYLVNVALATVLLPPRFAWLVLAVSLAGFGSLFELDRLSELGFALSPLDHQQMMKLHLRGMWVALAIAAVFIVYVVGRVTRSLGEREEELAAARSLSARKDKVTSLATLAAGAAHELSTPLTTIAVVARELERALAAQPAAVREDLALIRSQLERCQQILGQMSLRAGEGGGEPIVALSGNDWISRALAELPELDRVRVLVEGSAGEAVLSGPAAALGRSLRGLLKNAVQASSDDSPIELRLTADGGALQAEVIDLGCGIPAGDLSRVGEPFFTTKPPGQGMGLGLFISRALVEQLGGSLQIFSAQGEGTRASLRLPLAK